MHLKFFQIPASGELAEEELNKFLRSHRVLRLDRELTRRDSSPAWVVCVEYLEGAEPAIGSTWRSEERKVDYREVLNAQDFSVFSALREVRKSLAEAEGVPVYAVFTNDQLANLYKHREIEAAATLRKFRIVQTEGSRQVGRDVDFYNLDAIIAVGFRVHFLRATQFRQWATGILRDFAIRGSVIDKERLKIGAIFNEAYFDNLLAEIREIRASERRFYQKITDIYATAMDYSPQAESTQVFFAAVQNKLHFAIHGHTAAELIVNRADIVAQREGGTPQALSAFILFPLPAARNADVPVGSTESEASFSGTAPALGRRRVRPAPDRKCFHRPSAAFFLNRPARARGGAPEGERAPRDLLVLPHRLPKNL